MVYVDGFVAAVPTAEKAAFIKHAELAWEVFRDHGALEQIENWGDEVPHGEVTDFYRSVQAKDDETIVFSWIVWPDKATRDAGMTKMMEDPRMDLEHNPMPFDGKRMIYGGFEQIVAKRA